MKSKEGKEKWRNFINQYEKKIEDYNFGTMLRANAAWEYGEKETIFGELFCESDRFGIWAVLTGYTLAVRMQFYAIEIAR